MSRCWLILTLFISLLMATGCDTQNSGVVAEKEEKHFQRGQRLLRESRQGEALAAFLKVIEKRPDAPESHLEAGILYQQHVGDPIASIYHLRRYIEMRPDTAEAEKAQQMIETARKDFARSLPGQPYNSAIDRIDLLEMLDNARAENEQLKQQLADLRSAQPASVPPRQASEPASRIRYESSRSSAGAPSAPSNNTTIRQGSTTRAVSPRQYTVVSGDTLTRISTKVYGDSGRWQDIFEANRDQLPNPNALKVGQTLKIPE